MSKPLYVTEAGKPLHGVLAHFTNPAAVIHACEKVRDAGYAKWDMHTPFPIHGMEKAMGIKRTPLPMVAAIVGLTAASLGFTMQIWMNWDFKMVVQGKPPQAWEPLIPITFELGILFTAFTTLIGMLAMNGLPRHHHPLFNSERFLKSSDDQFFIAIESADAKFDPTHTRELLRAAGAVTVELVEE
jgi:hypothetical protein